MASKNIGKILLGLMTVTLLMTAMVPLGIADIDGRQGAAGVLVNESDLFVVEDDATSTITLEWLTIADVGDTNDAELTLTDEDGDTFVFGDDADETLTIEDTHGIQWVTFTLGELRADDVATGMYSGKITVSIDETAGAAAQLLSDEIWVEGVEDISGRTQLGKDTTTRFVNDFELEDGDGDDEINPGDSVVLTLELEGDQRYEDMIAQARLVTIDANDDVDEVLSDWDESREFNLADEQKMDLTAFEFQVDELVDLTEDYAIQVMFDSDDEDFDALYTFDVELEDDALLIRDVELSRTTMNAGDSVTVVARVYNNGEDVQEDIEISAEIAGLGVLVEDDFDTIGNLGNSNYEEWRVTMGIPATAESGSYTLKITAESEDGGKDVYATTIQVEGTENDVADLTAEDRTMDVGPNGATYTLTLENTGDTIETFTLVAEDAEWAVVSFDDEVVVEAGQTKTIEVTVTPKAGQTGSKQFTMTAQADGESVAQVTLNANLEGGVAQDQVIQVLQWVFAVIIIIAIILVIVWAVTKGRKDGEDGAYY